MSIKHSDLNKKRKASYRKPEEQESFLERFNEGLRPLEESLYTADGPQHPFLFIFGLPRSGTTLLSQLVAHCLDTGYINNLAARFWKAPVAGIKFAEAVLGSGPGSFKAFESHYGSTESLRDIHEFGYFWRHWLKKDSFEHIRDARAIEEEIDWAGLRKVLANMQRQFGKAMAFKNIFGSYHMEKLDEVLGRTLWIYIERDPLDTAVSILKARRKYFDDPDTWWSYVPPDYEKIIDKDYWHQVAGQVHYLKKFYYGEMERLEEEGNLLRLTYADVCSDPASALAAVREKLSGRYGYAMEQVADPPDQFEFSTYDDHAEEKKKFQTLLNEFKNNE